MKIDTVTPGRLQTLTCRLAASLGWATSGEPNSRPNKPSPHLSALHLPSRLEESPFAPGLAGKPRLVSRQGAGEGGREDEGSSPRALGSTLHLLHAFDELLPGDDAMASYQTAGGAATEECKELCLANGCVSNVLVASLRFRELATTYTHAGCERLFAQ